MRMFRAFVPPVALALATTLTLALATSGCGSKTVATTSAGQATTRTVPNIHFAKTKFVLHMGLAFGAFHRYISKPLAAGAFGPGAPHRVRSIVKAGTAALFAVHELRMAREDALADDRLRPLTERVERLLGRLVHLGSALKRGTLEPSAILGSAGAVSALSTASGALGAAIEEIAPAL
jgi:hypothetical protein